MADQANLLEILREEGVLTERQAEGALEAAEQVGVPLVALLLEQGLVQGPGLRDLLRRRLGLFEFDPESMDVDPDAARLVPLEEARRYRIIPVSVKMGELKRELRLAMVDPTDSHALDNVAITTGAAVEPLLALDTDLDAAIHATYQGIVTRVMNRRPCTESGALPDTDPGVLPDRERFGGELGANRLETMPLARAVTEADPVPLPASSLECQAMLELLIRKDVFTREAFEQELRRLSRGAPDDGSEDA